MLTGQYSLDNIATQIIEYESGELSDVATVELFQTLVDTGLLSQLQGSYQRIARLLFEEGLLVVP